MMKRVHSIRFITAVISCCIFVVPFHTMAASQKLVTDEGPDQEYLLLDHSYYPAPGEGYGWLWSEQNQMKVKVFWGDSEEILDHGAGTCMSGMMPGNKGPVILAGHVLSYFKPLQFLHVGDLLHLDTWYGTYDYEITDVEVYDQFELQKVIDHKIGREETDASSDERYISRVFLLEDGREDVPKDSQDPAADPDYSDRKIVWMHAVNDELPGRKEDKKEPDLEEELILYTCYPFYPTAEEKKERYTLIARKISGPSVIWVEQSPQMIFSEEN